jgi:hypothetical protein
MTRNDDFDQTLAAWLRREAPPQGPDRVLDAALERVAAQSQQRGWLQRLQGGTQMGRILRVAAVVAVVAFAAFIGYQFSNPSPDVGVSPSPSPSPSPSAEASASQTGLPSASFSPSTGPPAALVFRLEVSYELGGLAHLVTVLEDGRIITTSVPNPAVERRLTAAGVQLFRDELDATGMTFLASADYLPVSKPGVEPPGYGYDVPALEVGLPGGGKAMITWVLPPEGMRDSFQPQPEAEALEAMLARLSSLDDWLPASAWADANARPYAPRQYRILISSSPCPSGCRLPVVETSTVSWPLIEGIDAFGAAVQVVAHAQEPGIGTLLTRCRVVSAAEGAPLIEALESAGATFEGYSPVFPGGSFDLGYRATSRWVYIGIEPILPHADATCGVEITF